MRYTRVCLAAAADALPHAALGKYNEIVREGRRLGRWLVPFFPGVTADKILAVRAIVVAVLYSTNTGKMFTNLVTSSDFELCTIPEFGNNIDILKCIMHVDLNAVANIYSEFFD